MGTSTPGGPKLGPVVVGVDSSSPAAAAAMWAAAEADRRGQPLHIVYAVDTDGRALYLSAETIERAREAGRQLLDDTASRLEERYPSLRATREFSQREPVAALHSAAGTHGTIVVGNRGLGGFASGGLPTPCSTTPTAPSSSFRNGDRRERGA